jgi:hypothetical protein
MGERLGAPGSVKMFSQCSEAGFMFRYVCNFHCYKVTLRQFCHCMGVGCNFWDLEGCFL